LLVDSILSAKQLLGDRLLGVSVNDVPLEEIEKAKTLLSSYLDSAGIPLLSVTPSNRLLKSASVRELAERLNAEVLCRPDRLDLMVESISIGAMNVNSALEYFRKRSNMAVVTGGDRAEIQLAALETFTQCLILTGHLPPQPFILSRAEDLEIPVLSVDLDTLTTVEIVNRAFGQVRLHEQIKVECVRQIASQYFDIERLCNLLVI